MKPINYILLCCSLLLAPLCAAQEADNTSPASATDSAAALPTVTLRNEMSELVLDIGWAEILTFSLLDHSPLDLPAEIGGDETLDPDGPLHVLGPFNRNKTYAGHNSIDLPTANWSLSSNNEKSATFTRVVNDLEYALTYTLHDKLPQVFCTWSIKNPGLKSKTIPKTSITAINGIHQDLARNDAYFNGLYVFLDGELDSLDFPSLDGGAATSYLWTTNTEYIALRSRFFSSIWKPGAMEINTIKEASEEEPDAPIEDAPEGVRRREQSIESAAAQQSNPGNLPNIFVTAGAFKGGPLNATQHQVYLKIDFTDNSGNPFIVKPGKELVLNWSNTITSMRSSDVDLLPEAEAELEFASWWYRFFRSISKILLWMLNGLNGIFESMGMGAIAYGVAVLCTTAIVKGLLHRLTYKQQYSMMKMQQLAPELRRLQSQYKNDRQAMAMKQMELWKKHGVNPFGGCLPLLIQMPIFITLFQVFNHAGDMRGHGFLWVRDLTLPDQTIPLGFNWPFLGSPASINLLPLLYLPVALFQSMSMKITTPNSGDKQKDEMQASMQKMFRYMPVFFFLFIYFFAAGLVLYIFVSSLWSLIEIRMIRRKLGMDTPGGGAAPPAEPKEEPKKF